MHYPSPELRSARLASDQFRAKWTQAEHRNHVLPIGATITSTSANQTIHSFQRRIAMMLSKTIIAAALLCGAIGMPATIASAQQKSLKDQLVGTWTLASWERMLPDGSKVQSYGANPKGVVMFDPNGHMFVMFARPDLPKIASNNPTTATPEEAKAVMAGLIAYFGMYTVDDANKSISLRLDASTFPNQLAGEQKRTITSLTPDELKYDTIAVNGEKISISLRRAGASTVGSSPR
jgi:lipocalin-like protein